MLSHPDRLRHPQHHTSTFTSAAHPPRTLKGHVGRALGQLGGYAGVGDQVHPVNYQAMLDEAQHSTLLKIVARYAE